MRFWVGCLSTACLIKSLGLLFIPPERTSRVTCVTRGHDPAACRQKRSPLSSFGPHSWIPQGPQDGSGQLTTASLICARTDIGPRLAVEAGGVLPVDRFVPVAAAPPDPDLTTAATAGVGSEGGAATAAAVGVGSEAEAATSAAAAAGVSEEGAVEAAQAVEAAAAAAAAIAAATAVEAGAAALAVGTAAAAAGPLVIAATLPPPAAAEGRPSSLLSVDVSTTLVASPTAAAAVAAVLAVLLAPFGTGFCRARRAGARRASVAGRGDDYDGARGG